MRYKYRIGMLSAIVVLAVGASATAASAAIQFEWKVNGSALKSGASKEFVAKEKSGATYTFNSTVFGAKIELKSSVLTVTKGTAILGGKPGGIEGSLFLERFTIFRPANCQLNPIINPLGSILLGPLKGEAVESAEAGKGTGKTETLLTAKTGEVMGELQLEESGGGGCLLNGVNGKIEGALLMEVAPQKTEAKSGLLTFTAKSNEYENAKGEVKKAELELGVEGHPHATSLTGGEAETELISKEAFGAF
ncbi:MAG TPA: hypothetical protein VK790_09140 [Solirubrobacteraceae bacterium]|jgi:hypothetical protein|nr:hypothetical protein [Solirubrobacteraceae bacterium]